MANTGPPVRIEGRRRNPALPTDIQGEPVVSDLERAGLILGCDPGRLADAMAAAGLPPWGEHASGAAVFRWPELCQAARDHLRISTPATRPTVAAYRARRQAKQERKRQAVKQPRPPGPGQAGG